MGLVGWLLVASERVSSVEVAGRLNGVASRALVCSSAAVLVVVHTKHTAHTARPAEVCSGDGGPCSGGD